MSYTKSVCVSGEYTVTEIITMIFTYRGSGSGPAGTNRDPARGRYQRGGQRRILYSKVVQGPDPAPPEDSNVTEKLGDSTGTLSMVRRQGDLLKVDVGLPDVRPEFRPMKKNRSRTWTLDKTKRRPQYTVDNCTYDERSEDKGSVKLTRTS